LENIGERSYPIIQMIELIKNITFLAFDIETTGLTPVVDRVVEIGAVKFRHREVLDTFQELIDPEMPISPGAFAVNGITDEMVRGKSGIEQVLPRLIDFIGDATPMAHHAPFDVGFLSYDISRLKLSVPDKHVLDTCAIPKRIFPGLYSYSLENMASALSIKSKEFHRALADAEVCMKIFQKCVDEMGGPDLVTLQDMLKVNETSMTLESGNVLLEEQFLPLKKAIEEGDDLEIVYKDSRGTVSVRKITPLTMGMFRGTAMIEAFCHLRQDKRNFRLDRIIEIR